MSGQDHKNYLEDYLYKDYCATLFGKSEGPGKLQSSGAKIKKYPVFNGYEKRPIDFLRNVTDAAIPLLQMIIKEEFCDRLDINSESVFNTFKNKIKLESTWTKFAASKSFDDLNNLLKLMRMNCDNLEIPDILQELERENINSVAEYFVESKRMFKNDPISYNELDKSMIANNNQITTNYTLTYLIQGCRNLFSHIKDTLKQNLQQHHNQCFLQ